MIIVYLGMSFDHHVYLSNKFMIYTVVGAFFVDTIIAGILSWNKCIRDWSLVCNLDEEGNF